MFSHFRSKLHQSWSIIYSYSSTKFDSFQKIECEYVTERQTTDRRTRCNVLVEEPHKHFTIVIDYR